MRAQLVCRLRPGLIHSFDVAEPESVIGRDAGIAVPVAREGVSRRHARVLLEGSSYWIEDLKSTNGTFVNGQPVHKEKLYDLDVVSLGKEVDLVFVLRPEAPLAIKTTGIVRAVLVPLGGEAEAQPYEIGAGEATLGRSSACTIAAESGAVSKFHARLTRTPTQLQVEDLGSSNGTFVNGERVRTTVLQDGDLLSLAGVEAYRVAIERGEITSSSGARLVPELAAPSATSQSRRFSADWKTRFEWDSAEYRMLEQLRQPEEEAAAPAAPTLLRKPKEPPKAAPPAKAAAPAKAAPPASAPPASPPPPATAGPAQPRPAGPVPPPGAPPAAPPPPPAAPAPAAAPPAAVPAPPAPAPAAPSPASRPIAAVRLTAEGFDLVAAATGAHELGRASTAALRVDRPTVSRRHARIIISDDRTVAYVQDRGGANGTRLNRVAIEEPKVLQHGDVIGIGDVELKVAIERG